MSKSKNKNDKSKDSNNNCENAASVLTSNANELDCSICMDSLQYPCKLDCGHIFCFLCIKGSFVNHSSKCALCRAEISSDFLKTPNIVNIESEIAKQNDASEKPARVKKHAWYYEGRNGWWEYDERTNSELEHEFKQDKNKKFQLMISGSIYTIDFENKYQARLDDPNKKRRIKRDLKDLKSRKGVAGIPSTCRETNEES
jgi:E3 ubiquitin-protein ligase RNF146